jgi:hypothetical protein
MTPEDLRQNWKPGEVRRHAEEMVFRAFVEANRDELTRNTIFDMLGLGLYSPSQSCAIAQIDRALASLVEARRLVRVRKGVYSVVRREAADQNRAVA